MSTDNVPLSMCANCGKGEEESGHLKKCGACEMVKYCNAECQKAHRPQHKKECRKRAAKLHDEALFKQPPTPLEDCPICFLHMPSMITGYAYNSCCGKIICCGCGYAGAKMEGNVGQLCPFCRTPAPFSSEKAVKRFKKRAELGDAMAIYNIGCCYSDGSNGLPQDHTKALELWRRAGELGHAGAYYNVASAYWHGDGVERDAKKARHYYELSAMGGDVSARYNLGNAELRSGNLNEGLKHYLIAVEGGDHDSVKMIQRMYSNGHATKDDYAKALKSYQAYLDEIKSDDRDKAAAYSDGYKYYE